MASLLFVRTVKVAIKIMKAVSVSNPELAHSSSCQEYRKGCARCCSYSVGLIFNAYFPAFELPLKAKLKNLFLKA